MANSTLSHLNTPFTINYLYRNYFITIDVLKNALLQLPIAKAEPNAEKQITDKVLQVLELTRDLNKIGDKATDQRDRLTGKIKKLEDEIDQMVYSIYKITEKEKAVIEKE